MKGSYELMPIMNFTQLEPEVFVYLESDILWIQRVCQAVEHTLQPIRLQFMSPEEREKA